MTEDERLIQNNCYLTDICNYLTDTYPEISGTVYKNEIERLISERQTVQQTQKSLMANIPNDVMMLNTKQLRSELSELEIGNVPDTDILINLCKTIQQIQSGKKITINDMYEQALEEYKQGQLKDYFN